jgi:hypothetical protein
VSRVIQGVRDKIRVLFQSAGEEYRKTPIQFLGALGALVVLLIHVILNLYTKGAFLDRITQRFDTKIVTNLPTLGVSACLLVWSLLHLLKVQKPQKATFEFFDFGNCSWKIINPLDHERIEFEEIPYCKKHKVQLVENTYDENIHLSCPLCWSQSLSTKKHYDERFVRVKSIVLGRLHNHIENVDDSVLIGTRKKPADNKGNAPAQKDGG